MALLAETRTCVFDQVAKNQRAPKTICIKCWYDLKHHTKEKVETNIHVVSGTGGDPFQLVPVAATQISIEKILIIEAVCGLTDLALPPSEPVEGTKHSGGRRGQSKWPAGRAPSELPLPGFILPSSWVPEEIGAAPLPRDRVLSGPVRRGHTFVAVTLSAGPGLRASPGPRAKWLPAPGVGRGGSVWATRACAAGLVQLDWQWACWLRESGGLQSPSVRRQAAGVNAGGSGWDRGEA
ncbi:hypothetical protein NDU88_008678 [Pleurodeles waltl]|uniref:Uncharacterized protein n=1 Tax=Pleurodeles waltl TaxID=8319 RepID=A0AAV7P1L7_PLEWA|nr:hypothetical protein NDU88_008678 [Pleurodeles waltl]